VPFAKVSHGCLESSSQGTDSGVARHSWPASCVSRSSRSAGRRTSIRRDHRRHRGRDPDRLEEVLQGAEDLRSRFNQESGQIEVFAVKQIVETVEIPETQMTLEEAPADVPGAEVELGQEIEFPKPTDVLGRIAAQTAKQVIFQKVREAERDNVFAEYSGRVARS